MTGWLILFGLAAVIRIFSVFPEAIEKYYSMGFYPWIARILRILFGWIPFSIGDVIYALASVYLLKQFYLFLKMVIRKRANKSYLFEVFKSLVSGALGLYIIFNLFWGLNYNRKGIAFQLQLDVKPYTTRDLTGLLTVIVDRLNQYDSLSRTEREGYKNKQSLFSASVLSYQSLHRINPLFVYPAPSIKPSIYSYLGDYLGFSGYYNPFSGEAQVNTTVPVFVQPFTTCHEIGHQLGYAKENEANFAGYLSAKSSSSPAFRYSVYFDLYFYAARDLYMRDSTLLKPFRERLRPSVRKDYRDLQQFYQQFQNPVEPLIRSLYGNYLKANQQPQGIMSYNEVLAWLIAYYKKEGASSI